MAGLITRLAERGQDQPALADERGALTWTELDQRVNRWIDVLRGHGLTTGDRVAMVIGNRTETFEALLACLHAGLVAVPVSWRLTTPEIAYLLTDSGSRAVLTEPAYAARTAAAMVTGDAARDGLLPAEPLLAQADSDEPAGQCSGSVMLYTSATTGQPKGVRTSLLVPGAGLDRIAKTTQFLGSAFGLPERGRSLLVGPWYHAAQVFFSLFPLLRGCELVLRPRFDAAAMLADLERERITCCHLVPTQFVRLLALDQTTKDGFAGGALRRVWHGGAACPVEVKRRMIEWWGEVLVEYYAATEAGIVTTIESAEWLARPGSVGRPGPSTEVLILGEDGSPCPAGARGQVYIRRDARADFSYHNAPGKTAAAHRAAGTFTVGDLGYLDDDGYLFLTGRSPDTIISGGVNIYPAEIETVLLDHPAVRDAAVFGIPDEEFGERVMAAIELQPDAGLADADVPETLDAHCRPRLAGYKRPREYTVLAALPRADTGKLSRKVLRDPYWTG
jgi:acyl-CoA synthetase (AMP-forming)/AMP-acid ligase II